MKIVTVTQIQCIKHTGKDQSWYSGTHSRGWEREGEGERKVKAQKKPLAFLNSYTAFVVVVALNKVK